MHVVAVQINEISGSRFFGMDFFRKLAEIPMPWKFAMRICVYPIFHLTFQLSGMRETVHLRWIHNLSSSNFHLLYAISMRWHQSLVYIKMFAEQRPTYSKSVIQRQSFLYPIPRWVCLLGFGTFFDKNHCVADSYRKERHTIWNASVCGINHINPLHVRNEMYEYCFTSSTSLFRNCCCCYFRSARF